MNPTSANLLILEADLRLSETLKTYLQQALPEIMPLLARNVAEANVLMYQYQFQAHLIDINLEEGDGLEFVVDLKTILPDAAIVLMSSTPLVELDPHLRHLGHYSCIEKPIDLFQLEKTLRLLFPEASGSHSFQGSLRQMRLVDLIQVKCLSRDSCQLKINEAGGNTGVISIRNGEILYAHTDTLLGNDAFNEILLWKRGVFQEVPYSQGFEANIRGGWETLLMEAVHHSDECASLKVV
jgi:DNA-binding response OmpR family regulator